MERKKIILELDLVDWFEDIYNNDESNHIEKGKLIVTKNDCMYHIIHRQIDGFVNSVPLPLELVEKYITKEVVEDKVEEITNSYISELNMLKSELINALQVTVGNAINSKNEKTKGDNNNLIDIAKMVAVIQQPELMKNLKD
jgi:hypothetical protein